MAAASPPKKVKGLCIYRKWESNSRTGAAAVRCRGLEHFGRSKITALLTIIICSLLRHHVCAAYKKNASKKFISDQTTLAFLHLLKKVIPSALVLPNTHYIDTMPAQSTLIRAKTAFDFILTVLEKVTDEAFWESVLGQRLVNLGKRYFGNDFVVLSLVFYISCTSLSPIPLSIYLNVICSHRWYPVAGTPSDHL